MTSKRIALIGYSPKYFLAFARSLEQVGFEVYWVNALRSEAVSLEQESVPAARRLDISGINLRYISAEGCRSILAELEATLVPRINDIVLMDRHLRRAPYEQAIAYLGHAAASLSTFLKQNRIDIVSSGRDTALQLLTMLLCRKTGTPWVVPTRARIPQELYGFCQSHHTGAFVRLRDVEAEDRHWAEDTLKQFANAELRPAMKKSTRSFADVARLLPRHAKAFCAEMAKARFDRGNTFARYTLGQLVAKYVTRRMNMLAYLVFPACVPLGATPFCLYCLHTQPESSIDVVGSYFSDQLALITSIARSLPITHELYVKVHPTDVDGKSANFYRQIARIPNVRLIDFRIDSRQLLQRASLVFALSGTVAYEAGLLGRSVVVFARNFFNALPTLRFCDALPRLSSVISETIDKPPPTDFRERVIDFLAELRASCFDGEVNRTYGVSSEPLTPEDLRTGQRAYSDVYTRLVAERAATECTYSV